MYIVVLFVIDFSIKKKQKEMILKGCLLLNQV